MPDENHAHGGFRQARAAEVAYRQWGNITRRQLLAIGFTAREIEGMVERGLLHRLHRGVYALGATSRAPEAKWAAALLAAGDESALGRTSAASFYGQLTVREVTEVVAPKQRRGDTTLRVYEAKRFDVIERRGLRVTTPTQTLLDLAAVGWPIDRMTHEFAASGLVSLSVLRTFAHDRRGEPGAGALANAAGLPHTRSERERAFARWMRSLDIEQPILNDPIGHLTVDAHWRQHNLVIELDHEQTHGTAWARKTDEKRDAWLRRKGKEVWRIRAYGPAFAERLRGRLA